MTDATQPTPAVPSYLWTDKQRAYINGIEADRTRLTQQNAALLAALEATLPHINKNAFNWSEGDSPATYHGTKLWVVDTTRAAIRMAKEGA